MAVPLNTIQNVGRVGVREDLDSMIGELFPDETPFINAIGRHNIRNTYTEWQLDKLAPANEANATIQGDDTPNDVRANTTRVGNHTQIPRKVIGVSSTVEWTDKAGRRSELRRELMKAGREIRTDIEKRAVGNYGSVAAAAGVAGLFAGAQAWITTNANRGATGANGGFAAGVVAPAVNGTQRAAAEALLKDVLARCWAQGGNPTMVIMNSVQQTAFSAFPGNALNRRDGGDGKKIKIVAGADLYVGDFNRVVPVADRFADQRSMLVIDPEYWDLGVGQAMTTDELAKTGLSDKRVLYTEVTLRSLNEAASGVVADLL